MGENKLTKTSASQRRAVDKYNSKDEVKERRKYYVQKSTAKRFVENEMTTETDLLELKEKIKKRLENY